MNRLLSLGDRGYIYFDIVIETALVVKGLFNLSLLALEGLTNYFPIGDFTIDIRQIIAVSVSELRPLKSNIAL